MDTRFTRVVKNLEGGKYDAAVVRLANKLSKNIVGKKKVNWSETYTVSAREKVKKILNGGCYNFWAQDLLTGLEYAERVKDPNTGTTMMEDIITGKSIVIGNYI